MAATNQFSKIVVAIDQSKSANDVLVYAINLAKATGGKLFVVYAVENPPPTYAGLNASQLEKALYDQGKEFLEGMVKKATQEYDIHLEHVLKNGRASDAILETAKTIGADIIVIGSRGLGGFKEFLLGSTSYAVVNSSPVPVLIVRHPPE